MSFGKIAPGKNPPDEINVVIEIPSHSGPVKYEVDKATGTLFVDRFLTTPMYYPCNYGYVPQTLSEDGDPIDVLVITPIPLISGSAIRCRPIGMLAMTDESGVDTKLLAVPIDKLSNLYTNIKSYEDVSKHTLDSIAHFFAHYKDLEPNKWVKIDGWKGLDVAKKEILDSITRYQAK
ncbi:MAG: inorganic diphosphatase [Gammaproteobacteria bacterium]|nr:inorganic diphosphatase [Gammaproteobacteria bacterium]